MAIDNDYRIADSMIKRAFQAGENSTKAMPNVFLRPAVMPKTGKLFIDAGPYGESVGRVQVIYKKTVVVGLT